MRPNRVRICHCLVRYISPQGIVWTAIVGQIDQTESESEWVSVVDLQRQNLDTHPWSLGGGVAVSLKLAMDERAVAILGMKATAFGFMAITGEDEVFSRPFRRDFRRVGADEHLLRPFVGGDLIRDWSISPALTCIYDYDSKGSWNGSATPNAIFWPFRTNLQAGKAFGKTRQERGLDWREFAFIIKDKLGVPLSISFAEVATHNHFVFDRGTGVFRQTAPLIKLPSDADESNHAEIVGLLNSSTACFWLKQVCHNKGSTVDTKGARQTTDAFENFYQFNATKLKDVPLPAILPRYLAKSIDQLASKRRAHLPAQLAERFPMTSAEFEAHRDVTVDLLGRMISLQEELDWECYRLYEIIEQDCRYLETEETPWEPPPLALGERAFELVMARRMAAGELDTTWFARHGSTPITELPDHWPADYRALVERRIELIESDRFVGLIERPEYKRRWNVESWRDQERRALRNWLLNRLASSDYRPEKRLATVRTLAGRAATDRDFQQVATRYAGHAGVDIETLVADLVESESVPALPVQRYKPSGLAKRAEWERTWALQRREDEIDVEIAAATSRWEDETEVEYAARLQTEQRRRKQEEIGELAPPPKYRSGDFLNPTYWRLRGALDVPKERFVSLPQMSRDNDSTLLVGWAGWSALELCQAVAAYCAEVIELHGWTTNRLTPLLAVLQENLPWLKQWYNDMDPTYNLRLGDFFETFLRSQLSNHGLTAKDLRTWTPPITRPVQRLRRIDR